ncbi:DUF4181 domain-containing protein [Paenibacillus dakarensis]|uniref:DUF4181 domain-containing protein n=1 Tax=Paenibacillus dakarensis TaxID=1527293 RepID=UPI0006D55CD3|nr:DUF4181 domain-containing protein [Paenibacillus dakarensis]
MSSALSLLPILIIIIEWRLRKKFVPEDADRMSDTPGKRLYIAGGIISAVIIFSLLFILDFTNINIMKWTCLLVVTIVSGYNTFLYWKYIRESNEHIVSIISWIIGVVYILLFVF